LVFFETVFFVATEFSRFISELDRVDLAKKIAPNMEVAKQDYEYALTTMTPFLKNCSIDVKKIFLLQCKHGVIIS